MAVDELVMKDADRRTLMALIGQFLPDTRIAAFGSRVKGTARPWSDLDLAVFAAPEQKKNLPLLKEALDESNLPFRVDLLDWDYLPENFRKNILEHSLTIAEPK